MALFLSTYENKIDKKGRISVPALFRSALAGQHFSGVVAYPSFVNACIEACGMDRIEAIHKRIDTLDPFSEEHDAFTTTILGASVQLAFDSEGRITVPDLLLATAGITSTALFVGKGHTFEIWEPLIFRDHAAQARKIALEKRSALRAEGGV